MWFAEEYAFIRRLCKGEESCIDEGDSVLANAIHLELSDQRHQPLRSSSSDPNVVVVSDK